MLFTIQNTRYFKIIFRTNDVIETITLDLYYKPSTPICIVGWLTTPCDITAQTIQK